MTNVRSLKKEVFGGVRWTALSAACNTVVMFVQTVVLARILSPIDFGLMGLVLIVVNFSQIFSDMGVSNAIISRQSTTREQLSSLYWLNLIVGLTVSIFVLLFATLVAKFYHEPRLQSLIIKASALFIINALGQQFQTLFQKEFNFKLLALAGIMGYCTNFIVALLCAFSGMGVDALIYGFLSNSVVRVFILVVNSDPQWRPSLHFSVKDLKGYLSFGLYQVGDKTANYFNGYLIPILIGALLGPRVLGYYSLANDLAFRPIQTINLIITKVALPMFSRIQDDISRIKRNYFRIVAVLSFVNFPLTLGVASISSTAIPFIYGEQWNDSILLTKILCIAAMAYSIGTPLSPLLLARGRADKTFLWNVSKLIIYLPFLYTSIKAYGILGCVASYAILVFVASVLAAYFFLLKPLFGPCAKDLFVSLLPSLEVSLLTAGVIIFARLSFDFLPLPPLVLSQIALALIFYMLFIKFFRKNFLEEVKLLLGR